MTPARPASEAVSNHALMPRPCHQGFVDDESGGGTRPDDDGGRIVCTSTPADLVAARSTLTGARLAA